MQHQIRSGLASLLSCDYHLLKIDVNERTITHKLAIYYQALFPEWDVDCEYNRRFDKPKDVVLDIKDLLRRMADLLSTQQAEAALNLISRVKTNISEQGSIREELINLEQQLRDPQLEYDPENDLYWFLLRLLNHETIKKPVIPDIIVHKRGKKNNHIVIEAKKNSNNVLTPSKIASREYDILKLQAFVRDSRYSYKQGYFIDLPVKDAFAVHKNFIFTKDPYEPRIDIVTSRA